MSIPKSQRTCLGISNIAHFACIYPNPAKKCFARVFSAFFYLKIHWIHTELWVDLAPWGWRPLLRLDYFIYGRLEKVKQILLHDD
jgi:hypothetical protein